MQVESARELGLCFGVRRAVDMAHEAASRHSGLQTLGPLAHNRVLLQELEALGIRAVGSPELLRGPAVVIPAHGVPPSVSGALAARGLVVVDTTCPNVARAQHIAAALVRDSFTVVIFGDSSHTEVKGLLGWTGDSGVAALRVIDVALDSLPEQGRRVAVISQTTQRPEDFAAFSRELFAAVAARMDEFRVVNTVCDATARRQSAAAELARRVDVMLVIGGHHSANTARLTETCAAFVETHHIETADEIQAGWFSGKHRAGLTAGASTPDSVIDQVAARMAGL